MSVAIRVEHMRDVASILEKTYIIGMIRLELIGVKASEQKTRQIGAERKYHRDREEP